MKFSIKYFGCKVNQYEIEKIKETLQSYGNVFTKDYFKADYILINSCAVTDKAVIKLKKFVNQTKKKYTDIKIVLIGCAVNFIKKNNIKFNNVDILVPNSDKNKIPEFFGFNSKSQIMINEFTNHNRGLIKVQDGCKNFCTYCIIPYLRTEMFSYNPENIIEEINKLIDNGFYEIVLTGINLGEYKYDDYNLYSLLKKIVSIKKKFRIRLSSINVNYITKDIIKLIINNEKICNHLHIPLQSGSDKILKLMNRNYTQYDFLNTTDMIIKSKNNFGISTDVIVGFPEESEQEFSDTCNTLKKSGVFRTHIFRYSDRKGTSAYNFKNKVQNKIKTERHNRLKKITDNLYNRFIDLNLDNNFVIAVEPDYKNLKIYGYTENYIRCVNQDKYTESEFNDLIKKKFIDIRLCEKSDIRYKNLKFNPVYL